MCASVPSGELLDEGVIGFTIESRVLRELGERLVRQPEVALLELVKNAYDADATACGIVHAPPAQLTVIDNGHGMTIDEFREGWMRIGTSAKALVPRSRGMRRIIVGEKGIGRFAVRFLGRRLRLESVALDEGRGGKTVLTADFHWPVFDSTEDLGHIQIPYKLERASGDSALGTRLQVTELRPDALKIDLAAVSTGAIGVVTPYQSLLRTSDHNESVTQQGEPAQADPGFRLLIQPTPPETDDADLARGVLDQSVLRAVVELDQEQLRLRVFGRGAEDPRLEIVDRYPNTIGRVHADIRFFPQRKGTYSAMPIDGRRAKTWIKKHSGVAVFDRSFRVYPYGTEGDDWLMLSADTAKRAREPRSSIAMAHFPMNEPTRQSTQLNWMLRLPYPQQLVGVVQVEGRRSDDARGKDEGLIAAADREGFVENAAFRQLRDIVRGAVEALAAADRELQQELEREEQAQLVKSLRAQAREAIREIEANPNIARPEKARIVKHLAQTQALVQQHEDRARQREATLEVMSLLGVVAGYMTHEFGTALDELEKAHRQVVKLARRDDVFKEAASAIADHIASLREFVTYSQGYIHGANAVPTRAYTVKPRVQQVVRVFGKYATQRGIQVQLDIADDLLAPFVPVSLYNGIALNLFTNALKAVTAKAGNSSRRIAFRAWNDDVWHYLEVADTGIGIPAALRDRAFDPLFTTTSSNRDPLGSGMGLGLALVRRGTESFGGRVDVTDAPGDFTTCLRVRLPLTEPK